VIGMVEILGLVADEVGATTGPLAWVSAINMDNIGFVIVGVFVVTWVVALLIWKLGGLDRRWAATDAG